MNLAMLANQGWEVATQEAPLFYKLLKGRYFRRSSFLKAKMGANPSYGWRSLLEGRKVLDMGVRLRVGDGCNIDIWTDPCVPREIDFKVRGGGEWGVQLGFTTNHGGRVGHKSNRRAV
ncbi:hypothetical protein LIER_19618 [Lithospermum erythrorhizon]|uniref:Uncharacterized protein n=1 Tax=Lithospermum erythrorhizon TaxID=34254 RepID=A0AAV3QKQ0_LITER